MNNATLPLDSCRRPPARAALAAAAALLALLPAIGRGTPASAAPWLFVSDIHLAPNVDHWQPIRPGFDTPVPLFESALAAMRHADPNPPVVVIAGDFLAHRPFGQAEASATLRLIARRFAATFPHAQFALVLGNNDSACGDYAVQADSPFLHAVAAAWQPLVNRGGAAPDFARTFARDGFYTARLPGHLRLVALDDAFWSPRYHNACPAHLDGAHATADALDHALAQAGDGQRLWVLVHIPPGVDAYSTRLARGLVDVPFLDPTYREDLDRALTEQGRHVVLTVAGHIHRFEYRIVGAQGPDPVPLVVVPAISPIFGNNPSFLLADVDADGSLDDAREFSFVDHTWRELGSLRELGLVRFTPPQLEILQRRLLHDARLRREFLQLYDGGAPTRIDAASWSTYWCSATALSSSEFHRCTNEGGLGPFSRLGLAIVSGAILILVLPLTFAAWLLRRRTSRRIARPRT